MSSELDVILEWIGHWSTSFSVVYELLLYEKILGPVKNSRALHLGLVRCRPVVIEFGIWSILRNESHISLI
jgi:hypothetical protein